MPVLSFADKKKNQFLNTILSQSRSDDFILCLFEEYPSKDHKMMLSFLLFIYDNCELLENILRVNIDLLTIFKSKNSSFYPNYSELLTKKNIKIIQKKILQNNYDYVYILHELSEENQLKILDNDKYVLKILPLNNCSRFFKYLKNIDYLINNIKNDNIRVFLKLLFQDKNHYDNLNEKQKNRILDKIKKYIYDNPNCIVFVEKMLNVNYQNYTTFLLKCSQKNLKIWNFVDLDEEFIHKILYFTTNHSNICNYFTFPLSEKFLLNNIHYQPNLIRNFYQLNVNNLEKIILKLKHNKYLLKNFLLEISDEDVIKMDEIVTLLMSINSCYFSHFYMEYVLFYNIRFELLCTILKDNPCSCILQLYTQIPEEIQEQNVYELVKLWGNILHNFDLDYMLEIYGYEFIINCIKVNPSTIQCFIHDLGLDLNIEDLVLHNNFIVEYIDDVDLFVYCLKNISRDDSRFVSEETYNAYFLDACNAYILLHDQKMSSDINKEIYSYLV